MIQQYLSKLIACFTLCIFCNSKVFAQADSLNNLPALADSGKAAKSQLILGVSANYGFIFAHSIHIQNTKGAKPRGLELEIAEQISNNKAFQLFRCYPRTGVLFSYIDFDSELLGSSFSASYFLQPEYRLGNHVRAYLRGVVGLSYLTNPHDSVTNTENQTYSGHVNIFLQLGAGFSYNIGNRINITAAANFFHNSNGGFKEPNRGLNYPNVSLGINYFSRTNRLPKYKVVKDTLWKRIPVKFDAGILYSPKPGYGPHLNPERKFVIGAMFQASKRISNISAFTLAAEGYYDAAMRSVKVHIGDSTSSFLAGVLVGHEFIFNKFIFSQQLGVHVYKRTEAYNLYNPIYRTLYHRWGLRYEITPHIYAGFNFLAHAQIADFIDVRVLYRF